MSGKKSIVLLAIVAGALLLPGCFTGGTKQNTRYYMLNAAGGAPRTIKTNTAPAECIPIGVAPVVIPEYLDRPQIVTRISPTQINKAAFHRWAEPLTVNFGRALAENLSRYTCAEKIFFPYVQGNGSLFRVKVEVSQFDGVLGGAVELKVRWSIFEGNALQPRLTRLSRYAAAADSSSYEDLVLTMCRTLEAFSQEVFDALISLRKASP